MDELVFTDHIRKLRGGETPDDAAYRHMATILRSKLKQRGLFTRSPKLLGFAGQSWKDDETFGELLNACYVFAICDRIRGLFAQLDVKPNIEGLVTGNIDNFILAQRKKADPRGYAIGQTLKRVVMSLAASGQLESAFEAGVKSNDIIRRSAGQNPLDVDALRECIISDSEWAQLMPSIHGSTVDTAVGERLLRILDEGGFRFGDLVWTIRRMAEDTIPIDVNSSHETDWKAISAGMSEDFRTILPNLGYDDIEAVESAISGLISKVRSLERRGQKVKDRIESFLSLVGRKIAAGEIDEATSQADLARELGVSTSTLNEDIKQVRELMQIE